MKGGGFEPATIEIEAIIRPDPDNRGACLELDGGYYERSCWQLDGDSPAVHTRRYRDMRAGEYVVVLKIARGSKIDVVTRQFRIAGNEKGPD